MNFWGFESKKMKQDVKTMTLMFLIEENDRLAMEILETKSQDYGVSFLFWIIENFQGIVR